MVAVPPSSFSNGASACSNAPSTIAAYANQQFAEGRRCPRVSIRNSSGLTNSPIRFSTSSRSRLAEEVPMSTSSCPPLYRLSSTVNTVSSHHERAGSLADRQGLERPAKAPPATAAKRRPPGAACPCQGRRGRSTGRSSTGSSPASLRAPVIELRVKPACRQRVLLPLREVCELHRQLRQRATAGPG